MPPRIVAGFASALLLALLGSCAAEAPTETAVDLIATFSAAQVRRETRSIVPGEDGARRHLGDGWWNEAEVDGDATFVWSTGPSSILVFERLTTEDTVLVLDGRPFSYPGAPPQTVVASLNGEPLETLEWPPGRGVRKLSLPAEHLNAGSNELRLRYGRAQAPRDVIPDARDPRALGMAWYAFHFGAAGTEPAMPRAEPRTGRLVIPFGTQVDWYLALPADARLAVERWAIRDHDGGHLEVELEVEHSPPRTLARLAAGDDAGSVDLGSSTVDLVRLGLRAASDDGASSANGAAANGAVVLERPRIVAPRPHRPTDALVARPSSGPVTDGIVDRPPLVLIYLIDTLRADHLGCYGHSRPTSPNLDAFAARSTLFEEAIAASSWTKASVASVLTGLWPHAHGANLRTDTLAPEASTLAEVFRDAGYATAAFVTNPNVTATFGFDQGYDHMRDLGESSRADAVHDAALDWLDRQPADHPTFLYLHTLDPHGPYDPPAAFRKALAPDVPAEVVANANALLDDMQAGRRPVTEDSIDHLRALYDAEIAANDAAFGTLVADLEARGRFDEALIVVLSDHGEEFHEHGNFQHGRALHRESLHVPLIVKLPRQREGRRVAQRVRLIDVRPTMLDVAGLPQEEAERDRSLAGLASGQRLGSDEPPRTLAYLHLDGPARATVYDGPFKLIAQVAEPPRLVWPRLYALAEDPEETRDRAADATVRAGYLATLLRQALATPVRFSAAPTELDEEMRERLRALGYLD